MHITSHFNSSTDDILIVEDSPTQAERLKFILQKNNYRFESARNGREALAAIAARPPALVISDVVMPEMDGYELCRRLKQDETLRGIPVILLTSLNDPVDVIRGLECGADNFLFKPYDERYLLSRISYILANRHLREMESTRMGLEVVFAGRRFFITSDRLQILNLLLSTYEAAVERNRELASARDQLRGLNETLEIKVQERTAALQAEMAERRQAEANVREQAELLNKARDAIIAMDLDHRATFWNASAERLYGWSEAEVAGRDLRHIGLWDTERFAEGEAGLMERGEWRGEFEIFTKAGARRHVSNNWSLVRDADDRPRSLLLIQTDITEQKKLEADLLRAQRMESIGMLAGGVAHDLNNALAPVLMATELLQSGDVTAEQRQMLDVIRSGVDRGAAMVKQVLTFARGTEGKRGHVQLKHLLRELEELCRHTLPKNIALHMEREPRLWPLTADFTQIQQVLLNLCVNARDAMPDGGTLTIEATNVHVVAGDVPASFPEARPGPFVKLSVADTGTGMTPEVSARIFDPFFTTKPAGKGTGLGLSTVQAITKSHGGFIAVASAPGEGTTFCVYLPAAETGASASSAPVAALERPTGRGELILVADDEAGIRNIAAQTLQMFGYSVLTADNGAQAVALCAKHQEALSVLLIDLAMPIMDGIAAIQAVRKIVPDLKIILASGSSAAAEEDGVGQLGVGPLVRLQKPYSADQLLKAIQDVLNARR